MCRFGLAVLLSLLWFVGCAGVKKTGLTEEQIAMAALPAQGQQPGCSGGFVLSVGGETVTSAEVVEPLIEPFRKFARENDFEQFKRYAGGGVEQALINRISSVLLYLEAKKTGGKNIDEAIDKAVNAEVRQFIVGFGGDYAKAEEELKRMGMDWEQFREYQKKLIVSHSYLASQIPVQSALTHRQLLEYYNKVKEESFSTPAKLKFQLIDIQPSRLEITDGNSSREQQAVALAGSVYRLLENGEDFGQLARQYSHGHRAQFGGEWQTVEPESLAKPYDILARQAEKMQEGQVGSPLAAQDHIFIVKLLEKQGKTIQAFEKVQGQIESRILLQRRKEAIDELGYKLAERAISGQKGEFTEYCIAEIYRICNQ